MKHIFFSAVSLLIITTAWAQPPKPGAPKNILIQTYKPPKAITILGNYKDSVTVGVDEALQLAALPLKVTDDKKNMYPIFSYQFLYRRLGITEDEETGKTRPVTSIVADLFKSTPLPEIWIKNINEQLKPGEELYFFDVVAKDNQGHLFFAPALKIKIK